MHILEIERETDRFVGVCVKRSLRRSSTLLTDIVVHTVVACVLQCALFTVM
jgi:hypothetical protein